MTDPPTDTDALMDQVYDELRQLAAAHLSRERVGHTLQPTALVHEAWMRLARIDRIPWRDEKHFVLAAAGVIRRVLIDHARARGAAKRGGDAHRVTLAAVDASDHDAPNVDVLALDEALTALAALDERKARVVELRHFGGLTIAETASVIEVGTTTVEDDWAFARSWLQRRLGDDGGER